MKFVIAALFFTIPLFWSKTFGHHGRVGAPILYKADDLVILEGELIDIFWRFPHVRFGLSVPTNGTEETIWELEWGIPNVLEGQGITTDFFQIGDHIKAAGHIALRDDRSLGLLHLLLPNGQEFAPNGRALLWSSERVQTIQQEYDPSEVEAAKQTAKGFFRVWSSTKLPTQVDAAHNFDHLLTPVGQQALAAWDPVKHPVLECVPRGMPARMLAGPIEFLDGGEQISIKSIWWGGERVIHLESEHVPAGTGPTRLGYSRGSWDGDALVVETTHVDWPYFDRRGTPQSDQMEFVERFEMSTDETRMQYTLTGTDPVTFTEPVTVKTDWIWTPGREVYTSDCVLWDGK